MSKKVSQLTDDDVKQILVNPYNYAQKLKIPELVKLLKILSLSYYTKQPLVNDQIYDILRENLEKRDPKNKFLTEVGYELTKTDRSKEILPYPLYSLDKLKTVLLWLQKYSGPFLLSDKLDGISGLLCKKGKEIKLFTRGDGLRGMNISYLIEYFLSTFDMTKLPEECAIRGEIVISKNNYSTVKDKYLDHRSCIAGLVNTKKESLTEDKIALAKLCDFVAYELVFPRLTLDKQFSALKDWGVKLVDFTIEKQITNESLSEYLTKRRSESEYYIDGIVVGDCSKVYDIKPDGNPDHAFAFKLVFSNQIFETVVLSLEWNVSKDGYIKPVVILDPVVINGITISRVTGNNAQYIVSNKIGAGTVLKIIRSGDVIPKIVSVVSGQVDSPQMPTIKYKWNATGKDLIVGETTADTKNQILTKKITSFFTSMGVKFIGEGIVEKMVNAGYNSVEKILKADLEKLSEVNGLGKGVLTKIFDSIKATFETVDLATLMASSGVFGRAMGKKRIEIITKAIPTIMSEKTDDKLTEKINALDGFSTITTNQFVSGLDKFREFFQMLQGVDTISVKHLVDVKKDKLVDKTGADIFDNMKFVFTGPRNKEIKDFIESNGGKVGDSVSKMTNMLLYESENESGSSKYKKAVELNIKIMTYSDFKKKYMN
jgi:NAD-dependent DNA ligase